MHELPLQTFKENQSKWWNTAIKLVQQKQANVFSEFKLLIDIQSKSNVSTLLGLLEKTNSSYQLLKWILHAKYLLGAFE